MVGAFLAQPGGHRRVLPDVRNPELRPWTRARSKLHGEREGSNHELKLNDDISSRVIHLQAAEDTRMKGAIALRPSMVS